MLYPWQQGVWQTLVAMRDRLPHALLLQGREGIGKLDFAEALVAALLCEQPDAAGHACGHCDSCNWLAQGNHPDIRRLQPEEATAGEEEGEAKAPARKSQVISVDQVRELAEFLGLSSHRSGLRTVLLHPAEALNAASANALLKMLEEPPPGVVFVLVTHNPQRLLPTIRSRCNKIDMPFPDRAVAEAWLAEQGVTNPGERLAYCGGAPLIALRADDAAESRLADFHQALQRGPRLDPFSIGAACVKQGLASTVESLQKWVHDLAALRLTGELRYHASQQASLQALAETVDLPKLLEYQRLLNEARRTALHPLNAELQIESLLIQYTQLFVATARP